MKDEYILNGDQQKMLIQSILNMKIETLGQGRHYENLIVMLQNLPKKDQQKVSE